MKNHQLALYLLFILMVSSCSSKEFQIYSDPAYADLVEKEFQSRKVLAKHRTTPLFGVMSQTLTPNEIQAMKFLYAFMPLSDLADYDGDYFLGQVRSSLAARDTFSWGQTIPETEFRHFVLPYRINNENLDTARQVFFEELKDRIKDLSMLDAAMEVNHWCHEKVSYRGTDIRTSAPLATVKTAYGRCGEESTFTTAALRAVAIPARQVYTPRWAHSDDNHAWVEFWADGEWHYLGACEPSPIPSYGWFTEPGRRAMLIHTKAFGAYWGEERVDSESKQFSWLNTLETYAQTKDVFVKVLDRNNQAVENATVEFQLFNYAEFYPISEQTTDADGLCSFHTGLGDLKIWAHDGSLFNYAKVDVTHLDTLVLVLNQSPYHSKSETYDLNPPILRDPIQVSQEGMDLNNKRLKEEDAIRGAYEATFMTQEKAREIAREQGVDADEFANFIRLSEGNYFEISSFIKKVPEEVLPISMRLLGQVSKKDLRDTNYEILRDHAFGSHFFEQQFQGDQAFFDAYVLNPRVATEMLGIYRQTFLEVFMGDQGKSFIDQPEKIIDWVKNEIAINVGENYYETPLTPLGVYRLRVADELSAKIFAVAMLRSFGHPARLEPGTEYTQYFEDGVWKSVHFTKLDQIGSDRGRLIIQNDPNNAITPKYHIHFTVAKFKGGKYHTLHFDWEKPISDFEEGIELDAGYYMLVVGNRQNDGSVLHAQNFFQIEAGKEISKTVRLRTNNQEAEVIASIDLNASFQKEDGNDISLAEKADKDWQVIAWIDPDKEPTKHTFQDLPLLKKELEKIGIPFTFIIPESKLTDSFKNNDYSGLPSNHQFLIAKDLSELEALEQQTNKKLVDQLPVFIMANGEGEIIYLSSGYKIGIGEEIVKAVR